MEHEIFWKEVAAITLIAIFSFLFYTRSDRPILYGAFVLLSLALYIVTIAEEKHTRSKKMHDYFHHTSSYFILSTLFFIISYGVLEVYHSEFVMLTLSLAIILFSVGFTHLLFARLEE